MSLHNFILQILGEVGMVNSVHLDEKIAKVFFQGRGSGVTVATKSLKRVCNFLS